MNLFEMKKEFIYKFEALKEEYNINVLIDAFGFSSKINDKAILENASLLTFYIEDSELSKEWKVPQTLDTFSMCY